MLSKTILESLLTKHELQKFKKTGKIEIYSNSGRKTLVIGLCMIFGVMGRQNIKDGVQFIMDAANEEDIDSFVVLGLLYGYGFTDVQERLWLSQRFFRHAYTYNDAVAILHLGIMKKNILVKSIQAKMIKIL